MTLQYGQISGLGTRDLFLDLTDALETSEVIATPSVVSEAPTVIAVSAVAVNTVVAENGAAIGKGINWSIEVLVSDNRSTVGLTVGYVGDSGSKGTYAVTVPVVPILIK
jgi:hypothetical protein